MTIDEITGTEHGPNHGRKGWVPLECPWCLGNLKCINCYNGGGNYYWSLKCQGWCKRSYGYSTYNHPYDTADQRKAIDRLYEWRGEVGETTD